MNPNLDAGSVKLSGEVKDHVNPTSWLGDHDPRKVDLAKCWKRGAVLAASALTEHGLYSPAEVNFAAIAIAPEHTAPSQPGVLEGHATMLKPFGPNYKDNGRPGVSAGIVPRDAE